MKKECGFNVFSYGICTLLFTCIFDKIIIDIQKVNSYNSNCLNYNYCTEV